MQKCHAWQKKSHKKVIQQISINIGHDLLLDEHQLNANLHTTTLNSTTLPTHSRAHLACTETPPTPPDFSSLLHLACDWRQGGGRRSVSAAVTSVWVTQAGPPAAAVGFHSCTGEEMHGQRPVTTCPGPPCTQGTSDRGK